MQCALSSFGAVSSCSHHLLLAQPLLKLKSSTRRIFFCCHGGFACSLCAVRHQSQAETSVKHVHRAFRPCFTNAYIFLGAEKLSPKVILHTIVEANRRAPKLRRNDKSREHNPRDNRRNCDLELQILRFMEQSGKPNSFPSPEELTDAGRSDLVEAIIREGGWLTAGWNVGNDSRPPRAAKKKGGRKAKPYSVDIEERLGTKIIFEPSSNLKDVQQADPLKHHEHCKEDKQSSGLTVSALKEKSSYKRKKVQSNQQTVNRAHGWQGPNASFRDLSDAYVPTREITDNLTKPNHTVNFKGGGTNSQGEDSSAEEMSQKHQQSQELKGIAGANYENNIGDSLEWIREMVDDREQWIQQAKLIFQGHGPLSTQNKPKVSVIAARLRSLQSRLLATRAALRSSRGASLENEVDKMQEHAHTTRLAELLSISDSLEFREDEILRTRSELRKIHAQVVALEGKMALEIKDAHKALNEKDNVLKESQQVLGKLKAVRIVWPYCAFEVMLVGSYDGWTNQIKMEKSTAGVFVAAIRLFPGRYEIKFIVDGQWKVDPCRPIVYNDGHENNMVVIS